jgi:hypothetical protein
MLLILSGSKLTKIIFLNKEAINEVTSEFVHTWRLAKTDADGGDCKDLTIV